MIDNPDGRPDADPGPARDAAPVTDAAPGRLTSLAAAVRDLRHRRAAVVGLRVAGRGLEWLLRLAVPVVCAEVLLRAFPHRTKIDGVSFSIQATIFSRPGVSADTTIGNWEFPHFDGLPIGVHVTPVNVDLLRLTRDARSDTPTFAAQLRRDFVAQVPSMAGWLAAEALLGLAIGVLLVVLATVAVRQFLGRPARPLTGRRVCVRIGVGVLAVAVTAAYGVVSLNPNWTKQSRLTGTLAAIQLFPDQLKSYYDHQSKAYDALSAVIGIQSALEQQIERAGTPATAFEVMFISDVHLAAVYPLIQQYAANFDVKLIVNTGDESEFGSALEMTPAYTSAIASLTRSIPMIWLAGNHDSPEVATIMAGIPGVTVLGTKTEASDGSVSVGATRVDAGGLSIAGLPDPRIYGGAGPDGSDEATTVDGLERSAVDTAVAGIDPDDRFDIFATHEPVAAAELTTKLPDRIRQTNSGHLHAQNRTGDIQRGATINLVEGSTGAGGLDNIDRGPTRPPIEFSIESVAASCQFTKVTRFQLNDTSTSADVPTGSFGDDVSVSTLYLKAQLLTPGRVCAVPVTVSAPRPVG